MQNSASEFEDSHSEFAVYSSSGRLLQSSEGFKDAWEYSELAKQLDIKRSALYVEVRESELLLGCSLLVKIRKGREERAVFIECFPKGAVTEASSWINGFYADAKNQTEGLQSIRYQVIGLWKEGDIFDLATPKIPKSAGNLPDCLERKVLSREEVSVLTPDLSSGLFLLAGLIFNLNSVLFPGFSLALSLYPSQTDMSAGPGEPDPDFTFEGGKIRASAAHNKKENPEEKNEITGQIQEEDLKEHKNVFNRGDMPGSVFPKTPEGHSKKNKTWQKKKIAGYACCFFLFLIAGLLILSKAGLEPAFPSLNISKNNDTNFPPFRVQLEIRGDINPQIQDMRKENTSKTQLPKTQLPISNSPCSGSSNLSSVNPNERAENVSLKLQYLIKETNNNSESGNAGAGNVTAGNGSAENGILENKSLENKSLENKSLKNGIPENESNGYGILENKSTEHKVLENESGFNEALTL